MASIAFISGRNMNWPLPCGNHIVMTTTADASDFVMVNSTGRNGYPGRRSRLMAGFTQIGRTYMRCIFTSCHYAIMTVKTGLSGNGRMVKVNQPAIGGMTDIAGLRSHHMVNTHTTSDDTIVATLTGANHLGMVSCTGW